MMTVRRVVGWIVLASALAICGLYGASSRAQAPANSKPAAKPATAKVEKGPMRIEASLKGVLEAEQAFEVRLMPKAWVPEGRPAPLTVVKAVEHGAHVKKGDVLVELDLEKIDQAIRELRLEQAVAQAAAREAEEEALLLERSAPLDLAAAERARRVADEDLKRFLEVDRPLEEESVRQMVKNVVHGLESAREELRQLQKMYRSKDLTEDTEEFILNRHRHAVVMAEFELKQTTIKGDETLHIELPRKEQASREALARLTIAMDKARMLPMTLAQKRLALEKTRHDNQRGAERLKNLEADRETMTVRAPADGVVYYGRAAQGQWPAVSGLATKMQRGGQLSAEEVFLTVLSPRPAIVRATVEEKDLHLLRPGLAARVAFTGYPDLRVRGQVQQVSALPQAPGSFEARVTVELGKDADALVPGMACAAKVLAHDRKDALLVPTGAVFAEDADEDARYVYLWSDGKPEKRIVRVGHAAAGKTEIMEGLKEGDEILTAKP